MTDSDVNEIINKYKDFDLVLEQVKYYAYECTTSQTILHLVESLCKKAKALEEEIKKHA